MTAKNVCSDHHSHFTVIIAHKELNIAAWSPPRHSARLTLTPVMCAQPREALTVMRHIAIAKELLVRLDVESTAMSLLPPVLGRRSPLEVFLSGTWSPDRRAIQHAIITLKLKITSIEMGQ